MIQKLNDNHENSHRIKIIEEAIISPAKRQRTNSQSDTASTAPSYTTATPASTTTTTTPSAPTQAELELYVRASSDGIAYLGPGGGGTETSIFPTAARINHSCEPNVVFAVDHHGVYHLRARQRVRPGEELLVNYVPGFLSTAARKKETLENHGFVCACPRCRGRGDGGSGGTAAIPTTATSATTGFISAAQVRTFNVGQHQRAAEAGVDVDELHRRITELKGREAYLSGSRVVVSGAVQETAELFGVLYSIAEAYCGLGLALRRPANIDAAIAYHEKAAAEGRRQWGDDDVFVHEQRVCVMDLKVQRRKFV
ncbi:SET and MYND domain-containing protein 4 [Microdochium nivale]|nr:SET and MYND domain-containing protein 4 [Microdochium nivale]